MKDNRFYPQPKRLVLIICLCVFTTEVLITVLELLFQQYDPLIIGFFDAVFLTLLLLPALYFFVYRTMVRDIQERERLQVEINRLNRTNDLGEMVVSLAHEIRNPITVVRGFLQLLTEKEQAKNRLEDYEIMIEELDRANSIITQFLLFSKDKRLDLQKTTLNEVVLRLYPLLKASAQLVDKDLVLELKDIPQFYMDEKEICQLIINLCRNGLEAMSERGCLTISTYGETDGSVVLQVSDQGSGIEPELLAKLGTPFFTTKKDGNGLGLAVCYSVARRHNAKLDITSKLNAGTSVTVKFPQELQGEGLTLGKNGHIIKDNLKSPSEEEE